MAAAILVRRGLMICSIAWRLGRRRPLYARVVRASRISEDVKSSQTINSERASSIRHRWKASTRMIGLGACERYESEQS